MRVFIQKRYQLEFYRSLKQFFVYTVSFFQFHFHRRKTEKNGMYEKKKA